MSGITNIQQVLSNIAGIAKVQHLQQQQVHAEQSRHTSEGQKSAEIKGKMIEDKEPADSVEISVKDEQRESREERRKKDKEEKEESNQEEPAEKMMHIDITI